MVIDAIIQARMTSTRFPGKTLEKINGKVMIDYLIDSLLSKELSQWISQIAVAMPKEVESLKIEDHLYERYNKLPKDEENRMCGIKPVIFTFLGSEEDVLDRYYMCQSDGYAKDHILRLTGDCPLINIKLIKKLIEFYESFNGDVYCGLDVPNTVPDGMDAEIFPFWMLKEAHEKATDPYDREHITPYMKRNFPYKTIGTSIDFSSAKLSVDTPEDLQKVRDWIEYFQ